MVHIKLEVLESHPENINHQPPLLFVHGAYHGAWCWKENFLPYFSTKGFSTYALSLRGHGKSEGYEDLASFSLQDYMDDVLEIMALIKEKPVLIGHSIGGAVVQKIFDQYQDKVKAAVLMASVPFNGMKRDFIGFMVAHLKEALQVASFSSGKRSGLPAELFYTKYVIEEHRRQYMKLIQQESKRAQTDTLKRLVSKPENIRIPVLVIGSTTDWYISRKSTLRNGKAYNTKPVIIPDMSHNMMLDPNWKFVADNILNFLLDLT